MWAIYDEHRQIWWNREIGWVNNVAEATHFTSDEANAFHRNVPGKWIKVS